MREAAVDDVVGAGLEERDASLDVVAPGRPRGRRRAVPAACGAKRSPRWRPGPRRRSRSSAGRAWRRRASAESARCAYVAGVGQRRLELGGELGRGRRSGSDWRAWTSRGSGLRGGVYEQDPARSVALAEAGRRLYFPGASRSRRRGSCSLSLGSFLPRPIALRRADAAYPERGGRRTHAPLRTHAPAPSRPGGRQAPGRGREGHPRHRQWRWQPQQGLAVGQAPPRVRHRAPSRGELLPDPLRIEPSQVREIERGC